MKLLAFIKKEFYRFFHDPRLIVTMLLPGIVIFAVYSVMGSIIHEETEVNMEFEVCVVGESDALPALETAAESAGMKLTVTQEESVEVARGKVERGEATALLVFPEEGLFSVYYRSEDAGSLAFYGFVSGVFRSFESNDLTDTGALASDIASGLLPFLIVVFIFSACMSVTLESVAGEKERGTLATVLVTSIKRSHVVLGKVIPLSCISAIGAVSSFLGAAFSLPSLMGISLGGVFGSIGFLGFFLMFLLILGVVPLVVSLVTTVSAYAKSVKEASAYTGVLMVFIMVLSIASAFLSGIGDWVVAVPLLNAVVCMQGILTAAVPVWQSVVSIALNIGYTALLVLLISKMISSEKIMFGA